MKFSRRSLEVGSDGKADVMLLTNPIPRAVSVVDWGANDRPAVSWKSAADPAAAISVVRSAPPKSVTSRSSATAERIASFVSDTMEAWAAVMEDTLSQDISPADRSARVRSVTVHAGTRIAAAVTALGDAAVKSLVASSKDGMAPPARPPGSATLQGELDRRSFSEAIGEAANALVNGTAKILSGEAAGAYSYTEAILSLFGRAADAFSQWAASMPHGTVGVTEKSGRRHSKVDLERLSKLLEILRELVPDDGTSSKESETMKFTLKDLREVMESDPAGFVGLVDDARKKAIEADPSVAKKFMWGETGVEPLSVQEFLSQVKGLKDGNAFVSAIAAAVGGIDVESAAGEQQQVAAAMKTAFGKVIAAEIKANPNGEIATAIKSSLAPDIAESIVGTFKHVLDGGSNIGGDESDMFDVEEGLDPWKAALPGQND